MNKTMCIRPIHINYHVHHLVMVLYELSILDSLPIYFTINTTFVDLGYMFIRFFLNIVMPLLAYYLTFSILYGIHSMPEHGRKYMFSCTGCQKINKYDKVI